MKSNIIRLSVIAFFVLTVVSCRKEEQKTTVTKEGTVELEFKNVVGASNLKMDGTSYKNENGDDFTVNKFNYYISNIKLNNNNGTAYTEPESYHLIEQSSAASLSFDLSKVPAGTYKSISFMIGVDSLRNVSGAQSGALDPAKGMFWSWSTGYIMLKLEGTSPQSIQAGNTIMLHAGGFKGVNSVLRTITLNFPNTITVNGDENHIHLNADVQKVLGGTSKINLSTQSNIMSAGANAKALADNYQNMFSITAVGK